MKNNTSTYVGVSWSKNAKKWISQITIEGKTKYLGLFDNEGDANKKYLETLKIYSMKIPKEEPKQTVQEYEQQGLEKYSHELKSKQDYKKMSKKFTEILTIIPDDVLIKYTQQETLEEAGLKHCELIDNFPALENPLFSFKEGAKWQAERMYSDLSELRNDLYNKLPISDVDAFEILKVIKNHLQKLDVLCGNK